jgi:dTDP-4-dehydrorhamnose reductase
MRYLIIGGTGVIGNKIVQHLLLKKEDVMFTFLNNRQIFENSYLLDIQDSVKTKNLIKKIKPDIVIHCAAISNIDLCETNKELAESINVLGTKNIVEGCLKVNAKIIYVSTSFVFDGKRKYTENDSATPSTFYGQTKLKGEQIIQESNLPYLILRTDQPYCWIEKWQHTNSVIRVINSLKNNKKFFEIEDWFNVPTYVPDFVNATMKLIESKKEGIFHVSGTDFINRYEWAKITSKIFQLNSNLIESVNSSVLNLPTKRVDGNLNNDKLFQEIGMRMMGIEEGLKEMLKENPKC